MFELRPYQNEAVRATIRHFQKSKEPALIVLPTGAGKSLVIAELAKIARGRVLVLAHVKELVEQNHDKYESYDLKAGIYSAGLERKEVNEKAIFGSIQSVARADDELFKEFSIVIIDECHRISLEEASQYAQVIERLRKTNPGICILGLTATPFRLGTGWIYEIHYKRGVRTEKSRFFKKCIYELPLSYMVKNNYLTQPVLVDAPVACYDFSKLEKSSSGSFDTKQLEDLIKDQSRVTPLIVSNILELAEDRLGVMLFTSSVRHAKEVLKLLPSGQAALVVGDTELKQRDRIIEDFKSRKIKFLVNVSVLTTGFDAPHVDLIAILRPTESLSLYQQIVGRGLRLYEGKSDCLILDYTGQGYNIFSPEVGEDRPSPESVVCEVSCPECGHVNIFWGIKDEDGELLEHFGRKCQGIREDPKSSEIERCSFRFRFKRCPDCGEENDIAARVCSRCSLALVDDDKKLKDAMRLKDAHVLRVDSMFFEEGQDKKGRQRLEVRYYDFDAEYLSEFFYLNDQAEFRAFYYNFVRMHLRLPEKRFFFKSIDEIRRRQSEFRMPRFVIARKKKHFWQLREKVF